MPKCENLEGTFTFRLWPIFSASTLRRKLLEALSCGGCSRGKSKPPKRFVSPVPVARNKSERLLDFLKVEEDDDDGGSDHGFDEEEEETRRRELVVEEMREIVRRVQCGDMNAVKEVRRLTKEDKVAREMLAMVGVVPALVGIEASEFRDQIEVLYALLNVGVGNDLNKEAIVKAGAVHKMVALLASESTAPSISEAITANFLSLSALDTNKPIIATSGAIPFLVRSFTTNNSLQSKHDSLRALFNLSLFSSNTPHLFDDSANLVPSLIASVGELEIAERALSVLSSIVSTTSEGRRVVGGSTDAFPVLIDVLNWTDSPQCQEKAAYILMVMAYKGCGDVRRKMVDSGIVSSLLELTLLGTALAQKRASRLLERLTLNKGKQVSESFDGYGGSGGCSDVPAVSEPLASAAQGLKEEEAEDGCGKMSEEKKAVKQLVQQSLQNNMRRIAVRANLPQDFVPSDQFRALTASSTSKSLPF